MSKLFVWSRELIFDSKLPYYKLSLQPHAHRYETMRYAVGAVRLSRPIDIMQLGIWQFFEPKYIKFILFWLLRLSGEK